MNRLALFVVCLGGCLAMGQSPTRQIIYPDYAAQAQIYVPTPTEIVVQKKALEDFLARTSSKRKSSMTFKELSDKLLKMSDKQLSQPAIVYPPSICPGNAMVPITELETDTEKPFLSTGKPPR